MTTQNLIPRGVIWAHCGTDGGSGPSCNAQTWGPWRKSSLFPTRNAVTLCGFLCPTTLLGAPNFSCGMPTDSSGMEPASEDCEAWCVGSVAWNPECQGLACLWAAPRDVWKCEVIWGCYRGVGLISFSHWLGPLTGWDQWDVGRQEDGQALGRGLEKHPVFCSLSCPCVLHIERTRPTLLLPLQPSPSMTSRPERMKLTQTLSPGKLRWVTAHPQVHEWKINACFYKTLGDCASWFVITARPDRPHKEKCPTRSQ